MQFCRDCQHMCRSAFREFRCVRLSTLHTNLVTGITSYSAGPLCEDERYCNGSMLLGRKKCGPKGIYFELNVDRLEMPSTPPPQRK